MPHKDLSEDWILSTDEQLEAVEDMRVVCEMLIRALDDQYYWRWAIIVLHHSLQGFMVCALRGTDGLIPLTTRSRDRLVTYYRTGSNGPQPEERLDTFTNLFTKIQPPDPAALANGAINYMTRDTRGKAYEPDELHKQAVAAIDGHRNKFVHFVPRGYDLPVIDLPGYALRALDVVAFLIRDSGNIRFNEQDVAQKADLYLELAQAQCRLLQQQYDSQVGITPAMRAAEGRE